MPPAQLFATVLFDELARLGVRHVVLCPGSRSAPLAYAALAHERGGLLRVHVRADERAGAFLALGIGKATGAPAVVVTTSGTAVANCHPAVLEAHEGRVPLLLLTSDRPHELRWARASQTTAQAGIFGDSVRLALDLAAPVEAPDRMPFWRTCADRAVAAAVGAFGGMPGPVQMNLALREPLTPQWASGDAGASRGRDGSPDVSVGAGGYSLTGEQLPTAFQGRADGSAWTDPLGHADPPADCGPGQGLSFPVESFRPLRQVPSIDEVPRTLVVVGDAPEYVRRAAFHFARRRGHAVLAEPFGAVHAPPAAGAAPARRGLPLPHGLLLAETPFALDPASTPERLLMVGRLTLSRAVGALLRKSGASCEVFTCDSTWPDPSHLMQRVHHWTALLPGAEDAADANGVNTPVGADCRDAEPRQESRRFASVWERAAWRLSEVVETHVPPTWPSGPAAALAVLDALPEGARLFLGSSSLVRDVSYVRSRDRAEVVANRGLAGIDGCVSTAAGMALADPARATYALVGDLTFLHDGAALMIGPDEQVPHLTVVVVNDDGGAIFDTLEYGSEQAKGRDPQAFRRLFATPTGASLASLAGSFGAGYVRVDDAESLAQQVRRRPEGMRVVEVSVRVQRARQNRDRLVAAATRAVRSQD